MTGPAGADPRPGAAIDDPRMRGFRDRTPVDHVLERIDDAIVTLGPEIVPLADAAGRVLSAPVVAGFSVPHFDRAAMDGYAIRGEETFGASAYTPATFRVIGVLKPGQSSSAIVGPDEAVQIMTGAPIPPGADAVVKVEETQPLEDGRISVIEPTPPRRHVSRVGEDVRQGDRVFVPGRRLRPQDVAVLSALGLDQIEVVRRPRVSIVITGAELLPPGTPPFNHQIPDMNSPMLAALVQRDGGTPRVIGPLPDDRDALRDAILDAVARADLLLVSGGSSTGPEDHAPSIVAELGRLTVHGVAIRPASPFGLGEVGPIPVALMPGNPVSCLCAYDFFAGRIVRRLAGRTPEWAYRREERTLASKLVSVLGRTDYARVELDPSGRVVPLATSGAAVLTSTTRADGFVVVPHDLEGYGEGAPVVVWRYD